MLARGGDAEDLRRFHRLSANKLALAGCTAEVMRTCLVEASHLDVAACCNDVGACCNDVAACNNLVDACIKAAEACIIDVVASFFVAVPTNNIVDSSFPYQHPCR